MDFTGFPQETRRFLADLRYNNNRDWFEAHRDDYQNYYLEPARDFVIAAGEVLREIAPNVRAEPKILGSIFRINRDTRFSKDKRPYKDNLDFWFWEGERKRTVSGFFARITPEVVGIGAGCHGLNPEQLGAYRAALGDSQAGAELVRIATSVESAGYELGGRLHGSSRSRVEKSNLRTYLERSRALFVHIEGPIDHATNGPALLADCRDHWRRLEPLHRWLVEHVQGPGAEGQAASAARSRQRSIQRSASAADIGRLT